MVDEKPRQIEHAGHPGYHRDDVEGLDPIVEHEVPVSLIGRSRQAPQFKRFVKLLRTTPQIVD
jgi:hypothetical protein